MGQLIQPLANYTTAVSASVFTIDALTDFVAFRRRVFTNSPILKVEWFCNTKTGTPGNMGVVLCADVSGIPSISGGVPVDIGGGTPTLATVAAAAVTGNALNTTTFANGYTPAAGEYVWVVFYPLAATWDGSNFYTFRTGVGGIGAESVDECYASSANTGSTWSRNSTDFPCSSLLTTADAYLQSMVSVCPTATASPDWDNADNPDERGTAWTIPANTAAKLYGASFFYRSPANTADFEMKAWLDNTQQGTTRSCDVSVQEVTFPSARTSRLAFDSPPITISSAGTGRVTLIPTDATNGVRQNLLSFGTQARRESCLAFRDMWYCHRDGGSGNFTDDLTQAMILYPIVEHYGSGGGGAPSFGPHGGFPSFRGVG